MDWIFVASFSAYVVLAAVPAIMVRTSVWRRIALYLLLVILGTGIRYTVWGWFPSFGPLTYPLMAIVPVGCIGILLMCRVGTQKKVGTTIVLLLAALIVYGVIAKKISHAGAIYDGVTDWPSFLRGQAATRESLNDPDSAQFKDLWFNQYHGKWMMCGEINARNRMGGLIGYTRFYVALNDVLPRAEFDTKANSFDDFMRHCYGDAWNAPR